jgi:hypothetical protein
MKDNLDEYINKPYRRFKENITELEVLEIMDNRNHFVLNLYAKYPEKLKKKYKSLGKTFMEIYDPYEVMYDFDRPQMFYWDCFDICYDVIDEAQEFHIESVKKMIE